MRNFTPAPLTSKQIKILRIVRDNLAGKCSDETSTCPMYALPNGKESERASYHWSCRHCVDHFIPYYTDYEALKACKDRKTPLSILNQRPCPCSYGIADEVLLHLDELVDEEV